MSVVNEYKALCARPVHSSLQDLAEQMRGGAPVWPELPSGTVFACLSTGGPFEPERPLPMPPSRACRG